MKKFITALLLAFTVVFTLAGAGFNVNAEEDLIDLYPRDDENFAEEYGNSNWTVEFSGHRWHMVKRSTRHVSKFAGFNTEVDGQPKSVFVGGDVPSVFYPSGSGSLIVNDTDRDVLITSPGGTRIELTDVNNRFWAYFDETGKLYMYEDEFVNPQFITQDEGVEYFRFSTEEEIATFEAAAEEEKPENMRHSPIRIKRDADGVKIEPVSLGWKTEAENEIDSVVKEHDSSAVFIPAGHTVISFGEMARTAPVLGWTGTFPQLIEEDFAGLMTFQYNDTPAYFAGIEALDQNPNSADVTIIAGFNLEFTEAKLIAGVSARYIDEADDIADDGNRRIFKHAPFSVEVYEGEELLQTIDFTRNADDSAYEASEPLTAIDTSIFGQEYKLVYKTSSPLLDGDLVEENVVLSVGALPPTISGLETKYVPMHGYLNLYDGLTARDIENDVDITDSIVITHAPEFNPNFVPYGTHEITVQASWVFTQLALAEFHFPEAIDADQTLHTFDAATATLDFESPGTASRPNTVYTFKSKDALKSSGAAAQFTAWGRTTLIFEIETGLLLTKLDRFASTIPTVLDENNEPVEMTDYEYAAWIDEYVTEDTFVLHTHGAATSVETRAMEVGTSLTMVNFDEFFESTLVSTETFNVVGQDAVAPEVVVAQPTFTINSDAGYTSLAQALNPNVTITDNDKIQSVAFTGVTLNQLSIPGTYTVTVIAADRTGNNDRATFELVVAERAGGGSTVELEDQIDDLTEELDGLNDKIAELETALENNTGSGSKGTSLVVTIVIAVVAAGLSFGGAVLFVKK